MNYNFILNEIIKINFKNLSWCLYLNKTFNPDGKKMCFKHVNNYTVIFIMMIIVYRLKIQELFPIIVFLTAGRQVFFWFFFELRKPYLI